MRCRRSKSFRSRRLLKHLRSTLYFVGGHWCQCFTVDLTRSNAHDVLEGLHEDFAVADLARARGFDDCVDGGLHEEIGDGDLDPDFLVELENDGGAAVMLDDFAFTAVAAGTRERHAGHADTKERFFDGGQSVGSNNGDDEFHGISCDERCVDGSTIGKKSRTVNEIVQEMHNCCYSPYLSVRVTNATAEIIAEMGKFLIH